ncbi:hypothetical protein AB5I41_11295 [Sphingomonas sp. MMS24-JH45]
MLDRGIMVEHGEGYDYDGKPAFEVPARNIMPAPLKESDYFIAQHGYVSPSNQKSLSNDDRLNPDAFDEAEKFNRIRPAAVGGKSLIWDACSSLVARGFRGEQARGRRWRLADRLLRAAPSVFLCRALRRHLGSRENLPYLPDSEFQLLIDDDSWRSG